MQLHISPSWRHVTVLPSKGLREFIKVKVRSRRFSYRMVFYSLLFFTFLLRFVFVLTAVDNIDGESKCPNIGCLGKRLGPRILGRRLEATVPEVIYQVLEEPVNEEEKQGDAGIPETLEDFVADMKDTRPDAKTFASRLRAMVIFLEQRTRTAKIQEFLYRHVASSSIPKQLHCLALKLANEHSTNANARFQLPAPELVPSLVDNSFFHFVLASDNILAASVVASSLVRNSLHPNKVVLHIITDRKTLSPMQAWFSLHPLTPGIIEVKGLHHFDWFTKGKVPVLEAMEKDQKVRSQFRGGSSAIVANSTEKPKVIAAMLQALSPKYNSLMNHIRIHLPERFTSKSSFEGHARPSPRLRISVSMPRILVSIQLFSFAENILSSKNTLFSVVSMLLRTFSAEDWYQLLVSIPRSSARDLVLFPSLNKVVFLDDDIVIQTDLSPLWDIDMQGKVNGAVETCRGDDKYVMSKRLKSYLNFSHPLISKNFNPNECAWAYGMNIFDLEAWRKTNISRTYHYWLEENLKSDLSLWQLGTLPPGLIAFHGHVHIIDPFWHMLGLGYQDNTSIADAKSAGVVHFNGRAKPWLDIAFPQLRPLWSKYVNYSDKFIKGCHIGTS